MSEFSIHDLVHCIKSFELENERWRPHLHCLIIELLFGSEPVHPEKSAPKCCENVSSKIQRTTQLVKPSIHGIAANADLFTGTRDLEQTRRTWCAREIRACDLRYDPAPILPLCSLIQRSNDRRHVRKKLQQMIPFRVVEHELSLIFTNGETLPQIGTISICTQC